MENKKIKKKVSTKFIFIIVISIVLVLSVIGYTYSFFAAEAKDEISIRGEAASINLELTVTRVAPEQDKKLIPQLDSAIEKAVIGKNGNCLDDNNNAICQVYKINVKNTSSIATFFSGTLELTIANNTNLRWAKISGISNTTLESKVNTRSDTLITTNEMYAAGETKDYYIVIWISETGASQTDNGEFKGVVTFGSVSSNGALATLTNLGITTEGDKFISFSGASKEDDTTGTYAAEDDLGISYYFRGNVTNNYVKFAGFYWRIVRINGDGTIRLIYDGASAHANNESTTDKQVGTSAFNASSNDNAYVGYMYGTPGSTTYKDTHTNTKNSTIKTYLDNWYKTNIVDRGYSNFVADAIYCSNRVIATNKIINNAYLATGEGFGTHTTLYSPFDRLGIGVGGSYESITPILKCEQVNDRFTKETMIGNIEGNGKLQYPIGLITLDEVAFAGAYLATTNNESYLYNGTNTFWTLSPASLESSNSRVFYISDGGIVYGNSVATSYGVRPVISINQTAITGGTGSAANPFIVG